MTYDERARLQALRDLRILDTVEEERFDRVVRMAQGLFDVPIVAVSLIDSDRQWFKSSVGIEYRETPRSAFCDEAIREPGPFVVPNASEDERFRNSPSVTSGPGVRFYAGHPINSPGGQPVGTLCMIDTKPRDMTPGELNLLADLAGWVQQELAMDEELLRAREVQRALLPRTAPAVPGYDIAGLCVPSRELGGDFFDWFWVHGQFQVTLADVMGKGISAAIIAASVRAMLRGASRFNDLETALNRSAEALQADFDDTDSFATLFTGRFDPESGELTYIDTGHGLTAVIDPWGQSRWLESDALPLGVVNGDKWVANRITLNPGDTLISVSDGFLELFESRESGLEAAIEATLTCPSAQDIVDEATEYASAQMCLDDATVLVVKRNAVE